ncbi:MAG: hypothetical protein KKC18_06250 [Chloroflexi bacterium]|nr:hypothetical protein [Chloroflexota bacterium]
MEKSKNAQARKFPWLQISLVMSVVVLIGLFPPWIQGLDFGGRSIGVATVRGWNIKWLPITALIAVGGHIVAYFKEQRIRWLGLAIVCSIGSLIPIISIGVLMTQMSASDDSLYGNVLILSKTPMIGFWITLIGLVGMIVCGVGSIIAERSLSPKGEV